MNNIPLSQPDITNAEQQAVLKVLKSRRLALGPYVQEFEKAVARYTGVKYAVATSSGTAALHLLIRGFQIDVGDEVITTPFSFIASANCILFERAKPVFVDIDPQTLCIDPRKIEAAITPRTKAILAVDVFGHPCAWDQLTAIAKKHRLLLIEDACEALGSSWQGKKCGGFGDAAVLAFYPNKQITTGEGGMILTNNPKTAGLAQSMRNQGRSNYQWLQHQILGYNYRLDEMSAALGYVQMRRLPRLLSKRAKNANTYRRLLLQAQIPTIMIPTEYYGAKVSWFVYVVRLGKKFSGAKRDEIIRQMDKAGIKTGNYFPAIHLQPFYRQLYSFKSGDFPVTESIAKETLALPFYNDLTITKIKKIVRILTLLMQ